MYMSYTSKNNPKHAYKVRWKYTDEELMASAAQYPHRSHWKRYANNHYQAASSRGLLDRCCAHMTPMASPFAADYEIYVYEFADKHAYVGLTFLPRARQYAHKVSGPVAEHADVCGTYTRKVLATSLTREQAPEAEKLAIAQYKNEGWTMLNRNSGGSVGTVRGRKWTKELIVAEARKFTTRQAWIDGSQGSYRVAKREGWFEEASAHMPKRDGTSQIGHKVSAATRRKQSAVKLGRPQTPEHRAARSAAVKLWWASRRA